MEHSYPSCELPMRLPQPPGDEAPTIKYVLTPGGPHQAVPISLYLTSKYIVVGMDEGIIYVFSLDGNFQRKLDGNTNIVFATAVWDDTLISGGTDRSIVVWNLATGERICTMTGHTGTIRSLVFANSKTVISGSRDHDLRIWVLDAWICTFRLEGHNSFIRCLAIHGDTVVSGSNDSICRVWSVSEGRCLKTLIGHSDTVYSVAFDNVRIATGSLDSDVRIWDLASGTCTAIFRGHTSLVTQIQFQGNILVTGGADACIRTWSLDTMTPIHCLAAHEYSVTSLQSNDSYIVSGGCDGRVRIWDLQTGHLVSDVGDRAMNVWHVKTVWKAKLGQGCLVVLAAREGKTLLEINEFQESSVKS